jgi:hypothetical protein
MCSFHFFTVANSSGYFFSTSYFYFIFNYSSTMVGLLHFSLSTLSHSTNRLRVDLQVLVVQSPAPPSLQIKEQPPSPGSPSAEMYSGGTQIYLQVISKHFDRSSESFPPPSSSLPLTLPSII